MSLHHSSPIRYNLGYLQQTIYGITFEDGVLGLIWNKRIVEEFRRIEILWKNSYMILWNKRIEVHKMLQNSNSSFHRNFQGKISRGKTSCFLLLAFDFLCFSIVLPTKIIFANFGFTSGGI